MLHVVFCILLLVIYMLLITTVWEERANLSAIVYL